MNLKKNNFISDCAEIVLKLGCIFKKMFKSNLKRQCP
tara:strand:+ start:408 stop:518 length:111 start_codon:yes stop_codon:yes gene_type:complete